MVLLVRHAYRKSDELALENTLGLIHRTDTTDT